MAAPSLESSFCIPNGVITEVGEELEEHVRRGHMTHQYGQRQPPPAQARPPVLSCIRL